MAENDLTKENCMEMLRDAYKQLERYPKKSDFTVEILFWPLAKSTGSVWDTAGSFSGTGGSKAAETDRCEKAADTV